MDVKMTFLNGDLEKEIYMKQLEGFSSSGVQAEEIHIWIEISFLSMVFQIS